MRVLKFAAFFLVLFGFSSLIYFQVNAQEEESVKVFNEEEPDLPAGVKIDKEEYFRLRNEYIDMVRGFDTASQQSRTRAVRELEQSERRLEQRRAARNQPLVSLWNPLGPAPIPINANTSYSGRVSAIAVHPTNPNIVYVGTAQGGLYRTLNGGATWTPLMDNALTITIGAVAISPSDPTTVFVGTGEAALCGSGCFIGVGLYRITNADTNPVLSPVLNKDASGNDVFTGRAISEIVMHPTDPNILFTTSTRGIAGIGSTTTGLNLPDAGVYRSTNAMSANPTFQKLAIQGTGGASRSVVDAVIEPGNAARLIVTVLAENGESSDGGVYLSTNALDAAPTFTRTLATDNGSSLGRAELAINKVGDVTTVYVASGMGTGTLYKSVDGGSSFAVAVDNNFCNPQCFYDIAVAVDPNDANKVYLGGSPTLVFGRSTNGGTSFTNSSSGLHVDTQAFALAPSDPNIMYFGSDGGIWRTMNVNSAGAISWQTLNNTSFSATQFMSLALHPLDRHYSLGGTQDNGTEFLAPNGTTWVQSDGGDGGFVVIDKNSPTINNVTAYHTYFNQTNTQIGFSRATTTVANGDPNWGTLLGCRNGTSSNGILCADPVLFYAPMVLGPGTPNTLYFGTNRLYRSANTGTTMTDVSGTLPARVSAIAISPQDDNVRLVGLTNGGLYASFTSETTMVNVTGAVPPRYVGRVAIDPTNSNVAYVALNGYGLPNGHHVWKTTNLTTGATWTPAGNGIPDVPVNTFVVDPANTQTLFAGTDIGVFRSTNGGANWEPFSEGLPRVAVFGMEIQPVNRVLKIATHGRGIWEKNLQVANRRVVADFDGDGKTDVSVFRQSNGTWYLQQSTSGFSGVNFGASTDRIVPEDYDGDGRTDIAVYRGGTWYLQRSTAGFTGVAFGAADDIPQPADFDGDGRSELAVFRPSNGIWYSYNLANGQTTAVLFGQAGDRPVAADYDGDSKADVAVYRGGTWYILQSQVGMTAYQFGTATDTPVIGDYDGDSRSDVAVYRPATGYWYVLKSSGGVQTVQYGATGDLPAQGDFDGDGKTDFTVFRPSEGRWYILTSTTGVQRVETFGLGTDIPVSSQQNPQ